MSGIFGILNMGKGALLTQQRAINVTGHNISNVNTDGYSRQNVLMGTNLPISTRPGQIGTGVHAMEVRRIYDRFLGLQINNENQGLGRWEARKSAIGTIETILNESSGSGLNQAMSEFWNAWQDLANNPSGLTERTCLLEKGELLAMRFQQVYTDLGQVQKDVDNNITGTIQEINRITEQIADLNHKISGIEANGQNANDYRDSRDLLVKELSSLIDISTFEDDTGMVSVITGGGRSLVQGDHYRSLSTETNVDGFQDIIWLDGYGNSENITEDITDGKLYGLLEVRDSDIPDYLSELDTLAARIIEEVNTLHSSGYGLDGNNGRDFFTGTSAADIGINSAIQSDVNLIAAAQDPNGLPGDNTIAIAIANLQNELTMNGNTVTFDDYYNSIVSQVGSEANTAATNYDQQSKMVTYLDSYRESISGVSLDEEMVNLVKFQHAYEAAAQLISTADELLDTVIGMI